MPTESNNLSRRLHVALQKLREEYDEDSVEADLVLNIEAAFCDLAEEVENGDDSWSKDVIQRVEEVIREETKK